MRLPIPDDWDGKKWRCVTINWPDSTDWFGVFMGLLTQCQRGFYWNEKTGIVIEAQAIGKEIFDRNFPFTDCDGNPITDKPDSDFLHAVACGLDELEGLAMSLCGYNPKAFRVVEGILSVRDFCGEWVEIGAVGVTSTPPIDDELEWPVDSEFSACGKAWAITDLLKRVGNTIWDQRDNDPVSAWSNVSSLYPNIMSMGYTLNAALGAAAIEAAQDIAQGWYGPELFDESTWQAITCSLTASLDDTETLPDKNTLFSLIMAKINAQWPLDPLAQAYWWNVGKAIGENDLRNQGLGGATDVDRDCDCPQIAIPPYYGNLKFVNSFTATYPGQIQLAVGNNGKYVDVRWSAEESSFKSNDNVVIAMAGGEGTDSVKLLVTPLSGSNMPTEQWVEQNLCPVTDALQWVIAYPGTNTGRTETQSVVAGGYTMLAEWTASIVLGSTTVNPRKCGGSVSTPAQVYQFRIEIIEHNGVAV